MNSVTLQALRRLLFFTPAEAAALVAASETRPQGVNERAWQLWETGAKPVPADIAERIEWLCGWREDAIEAASEQIDEAAELHGEDATDITLVYYTSMADWIGLGGRDPVLWRPHCAVMAELAARHAAHLVAFDRPAYDRWRGQRADSEALRGQWAGELGDD